MEGKSDAESGMAWRGERYYNRTGNGSCNGIEEAGVSNIWEEDFIRPED